MASTNILKKQASVYDLAIALHGSEFDENRIYDLNTKHYFAPGVYAREAILPAGSVTIGKTQKKEHIAIFSKGDCTVHCMGEVIEVHAPFTFVAAAGSKKAIYAHTEVVLTTIHATTETDIDKIEKEVIDDMAEITYEQQRRLKL